MLGCWDISLSVDRSAQLQVTLPLRVQLYISASSHELHPIRYPGVEDINGVLDVLMMKPNPET